ncbi:hypothetical protein F8388_026634 [Cannabis sativa]|uniref:Uncharacterized protein n=1 Tax=Cannabis sativa TaxID=3483 RepID=A0A7J6EAQ0_CANSA|nr:hypothetical protein F8388_026634 [Cannabis sativa]
MIKSPKISSSSPIFVTLADRSFQFNSSDISHSPVHDLKHSILLFNNSSSTREAIMVMPFIQLERSEGSGIFQDEIDMEIAASEASSALTRKCTSMNSDMNADFCFPKQVD